MAKTVPLDARTLAWAHRLFQGYYASASVDPPSRFARREFAAFPFSEQTLMRRHASFRSVEEFQQFLLREAPRHVYYSSAYYRVPDHSTMAGKEWLGADLIFDLDADHLKGAESLTYAEQLGRVREKTRTLVDDFLLGDFGLAPDSLTLVFSGGRGYHVHVHDPAYWPLSSPERRELVEYIQGSGVVAADAVREVRDADRGAAAEGDGESGPRGRAARVRAFKRLAPPDTPGWKGRTTRGLLALLERWASAGAPAAAEQMVALGLTRSEARSLARKLVTEGRGEQIRSTLSLEVFKGGVPEEFLTTVLRGAAIEVQGETDAPVTTDIHRLIRLPGSLHGGTGFRVVPIDRARLDSFDPFREAILPHSRSSHETVELAAAVDYPFEGLPSQGASAGARVELPTPVALFLVLRGEARLPPAPG